MAFEPRENDEIFFTPAQERAAEERNEWFGEVAQSVAIQAMRLVIREAKKDGFDHAELLEQVLDRMMGQDVLEQALSAEMTTAERHQSFSNATKQMLGAE